MSNDNTDVLNELRRACAEILGNDGDTWPDHGNAALAIAAALGLYVNAARTLETENARLRQHIEAAQKQEPAAWVRYRSDGGFEGPIMDTDARMCDTRRGFWTPLFAGPAIEVAPDNSQAAALSAANRGEDARDAARYRRWRDAAIANDTVFARNVRKALPPEARDGKPRWPIASEWDAAIDAAIAQSTARDGKERT
ncbi:hypothetical protein [Chitinasiproducens palmae]|uniref:Uncharacterized protein n=1 Tax=Chitinasiproducens palmae TaxID=1770053 RepID=A0A1H2PN04_9BURK|nr:hypothetical protein [Chitinasiproducens palmae]SDV47943.1 hypothetical protein SAMN05216551_10420 [Chitinasiproducens palmae]